MKITSYLSRIIISYSALSICILQCMCVQAVNDSVMVDPYGHKPVYMEEIDDHLLNKLWQGYEKQLQASPELTRLISSALPFTYLDQLTFSYYKPELFFQPETFFINDFVLSLLKERIVNAPIQRSVGSTESEKEEAFIDRILEMLLQSSKIKIHLRNENNRNLMSKIISRVDELKGKHPHYPITHLELRDFTMDMITSFINSFSIESEQLVVLSLHNIHHVGSTPRKKKRTSDEVNHVSLRAPMNSWKNLYSFRISSWSQIDSLPHWMQEMINQIFHLPSLRELSIVTSLIPAEMKSEKKCLQSLQKLKIQGNRGATAESLAPVFFYCGDSIQELQLKDILWDPNVTHGMDEVRTILHLIKHMHNLEAIDISRTDFADINFGIQFLTDLLHSKPGLKRFHASFVGIGVMINHSETEALSFLSSLSNMAHLEELDLSETSMMRSGLDIQVLNYILSNKSNLKVLKLNRNSWKGIKSHEFMKTLSGLNQLEELELDSVFAEYRFESNNYIDKDLLFTILQHIPKVNLKKISLQRNLFGDPSDKLGLSMLIFLLKKFKGLQVINLRGNNITNESDMDLLVSLQLSFKDTRIYLA